MKNNSGFTLAELMVAISIMAILSAIALPAYTTWLPGYKMNSAARELYSSLQQAKMAAIKSNTQYSVVFDQTVGGIDFAYIVFRDLDPGTNQPDFSYDGDEVDTTPGFPIMKTWESGARFSFDGIGGIDGVPDGVSFPGNVIGFRSNGIPVRDGGGDPSGGVFLKTDESGKTTSVTVSPAGSIRIQ